MFWRKKGCKTKVGHPLETFLETAFEREVVQVFQNRRFELNPLFTRHDAVFDGHGNMLGLWFHSGERSMEKSWTDESASVDWTSTHA